MELDRSVGELLALLDELKVADNTIVVFTTDNGAMSAWWPDGGATPFRGEKATTWEGGVRVPMLVRWPARIKAGLGLQRHPGAHWTSSRRWPPRRACRTSSDRLRKSHKVHIDGVNNLAHWTSGAPSARNIVYYYNESELTAIRIGPWKSHFKTRDGFFDYNRPSALIFNLRMDPFEQHDGQKADDIAMRLGVAWGGQVQDALGSAPEVAAGVPAAAEGRHAAHGGRAVILRRRGVRRAARLGAPRLDCRPSAHSGQSAGRGSLR